MNLPKEIFRMILGFACDYTKQDLFRHQNILIPSLNHVTRLEQCWNDYVYDDYGEYVTHTNTIFQVVWYLDNLENFYNNTFRVRSILKTLTNNDILNSYNCFDRGYLIVSNPDHNIDN